MPENNSYPYSEHVMAIKRRSLSLFEEDPTEDLAEDEGDLGKIPDAEIRKLVVTTIDWTVETLLSQMKRGTIDLMPEFQRRDAWTQTKKSRFIESLFLGLPVPQIVLAEKARGNFLVIDGKQRLTTLSYFGRRESLEDSSNPLVLSGLEYRTELNNQTLRSIESNPRLTGQLDAFLNQTIRTVVIKNWTDERILFLLFLRLNENSVKLSPQELRRALHPGPFITFIDNYCSVSPGLKSIFGNVPDFRMRDLEVLTRYYGFRFFPSTYRGNMREFLDHTTKTLNKKWKSSETEILEVANVFDLSVATTIEIFGQNAFQKWKSGKYEGRRNRAIIDIMTFYFSDPAVAKKAVKHADKVRKAFAELSKDSEFLGAIERTTKSLAATRIRFSSWAQALGAAINQKVKAPALPKG
jgi:hypothetical protein